jgi:hypothetical protein
MRKIVQILLLLLISKSQAQKSETITIPKGIVYNYVDYKTIEKAKKLIADNLSSNSDYKLLQDNLVIGPVLWNRFKDNQKIQKIEGRKLQFHVDNEVLDGKLSKNLNESKVIWDELKTEVANDFIIRKATPQELIYYWSVISFDIDEPLLIVETREHSYILNLLKKNLKLLWLDEAPKSDKINAPRATVAYQNGEIFDSVSKGEKETKLEQVIFLNSDAELVENSSFEDLKLIIEKTNAIFEELFKSSEKAGKIMVQFVLKEKKNEIEYAVKDDLDLDIMKVFEQRVNAESFPNSKKDPLKLQLLFKVNSFNEVE